MAHMSQAPGSNEPEESGESAQQPEQPQESRQSRRPSPRPRSQQMQGQLLPEESASDGSGAEAKRADRPSPRPRRAE